MNSREKRQAVRPAEGGQGAAGAPGPPASRAAARSVSAIAFHQAAQVLGGGLFVLLVPRQLGAEIYGQLAFCFSFIVIMQMAGELGYQEVYARFAPERLRQSGEPGLRAWFLPLFGIKILLGLGLGLAAAWAAPALAIWLTAGQAALVGLSVAARVWAMGAFPLLLGLGETSKWAAENAWRQIVITALVLAVARPPSLTAGLLVLALHEAAFLLLGLWWVRRWLRPAPPMGVGQGPWLGGLLRFGAAFSVANLALVVMFRISPLTVEWATGRHPEVAFFDLALSGLLFVYTFLGQVAYAFIPILTRLELDGQAAQAQAWLGRYLRYAGVIAALAAGGLWAIAGPAAPLLFGAEFESAAEALRAIAAGLLPLPLAWAAVVRSAVDRQPWRKIRAALAGVAVFGAAVLCLRPASAAGVALAFSLALAGYAAGFGRGAWQAAQAGGPKWALSAALAAGFIPLASAHFDSLPAALAAWAGVAALYLLAGLGLGIVQAGEVLEAARLVKT